MKIVIIKYNAGNIHSVRIALQRLGLEPIVSDDTRVIQNADKVIFPGVGEASSAMTYLSEKNISKLLPELQQPVLGICLGLQLMCQYSEENNTKCLGIFKTAVKKFPPEDKVPHMGWNTITHIRSDLLKKIKNDLKYLKSAISNPQSLNSLIPQSEIRNPQSAFFLLCFAS